MKTIKHLALTLLLACCAFTAAAQCSVDGKWGYTINPNRVHVFTDSSTVALGYQITTHYWTFGDGSTSQLANPTHQYINPGYYNVCEYIIATQIGGTVTCRDTVCRTVSNCDGMVQASFTVNVQGSTVIYTGTGTSNYPPLRYSWSLPGALPSSATTATVTASYTAPGAHNACLTVTDTNGCYATVCQNVTTTTTPCGNLVANFNASINNGFVYLSSTSTGSTTNTLYQWWRDGQAITNPTPNTATYQYAPAGVHSYCLYVYSAQNSFCDSACRSYTVDTCIADFQTSINNNVVTFRPQLSGPAADSYWNFGDGVGLVDTSASLTHTYPATPNATTYTVCHVWSKGNCADTVCKQIVIPGTSPCGNIVPNFTATQYNNKVILTSTSTGTNSNTLYQWFKDGSPIGNTTTNNSYLATGVTTGAHTFCLAVFANANTYCDSICKSITLVNCAGTAGFQTSLQSNVVTFYPAYPSASQSTWRFGDGSADVNDTSSQFTHTFPVSSTTQVYNVCHIRFYGPCGDTVCQQITIPGTSACNIQPNFTAQQVNNYKVILTSTSTGTTSSTLYQWFKDGVAITSPNPNIDYLATGVTVGTHTFCLKVYATTGVYCDSVCKNITLVPCAGTASFQTSIQNNVVTFYPSRTGGSTNYWYFGDGGFSYDTTAQFTHTYPISSNTEVYTVSHIRLSGPCADTVYQQITIPGTSPCGSIVPNFTATQYNNKVILTSTSTGTNSNTLYQWFQDFAGITAATSNTGYTATGVSTGAHTFCLAVFANTNTYCDSICKGITLVNCAGTAGFQTTVQGNVVTFYPANTGGAQNDWNFGDGSNTTSNGSSQFTHTYPSSPSTQVYTVLHIRLDGPCGDTVRQQITIPGTTTCGTASFTSSQTSGHLVLTSTSTGTNTNVVWAIRNLNGVGVLTGSGSPFTAATLPNGTYQVCLYLYNANQQLCDTTCQTIAVTNSNPCNGLTAQWTQLYNRNDTVAFRASNTVSGATYYWNFGDGQWANTADPVHRYVGGGNYTVCLVVELPGTTCSDTVCQPVTINCHPTATLSAVNNVSNVVLTASSTGLTTPVTYAWSNGATGQTITVSTPGQYCVTAIGSNNVCSATDCYTFNGPACDTAGFTSTHNGGTFVFSSNHSGSNTRIYTIRTLNGGTLVSTGTGDPYTAILNSGAYQVCQAIYNSSQQLCDSACLNITFNNTPNCLVLQPNDTAGKDAILASIDPAVNYGNHVNFFSDVWTHSSVPIEDRSLLQFNLSSIPTGSAIVSARLSLYADTLSIAGYMGQPTYGNNASYLKLVTAPWAENTVTWNTQPATTTTGQILLATSTNTRQDYLNIDISGFAQQWVNNPAQNYGMMLDMITTTPYALMAFGSSDHPNATKRPRLEICYTPCNATATITRISNAGTERLEASATGITNATYSWSTGATTASITITTAGNYCVTITGSSNCTATACYNYTPTTCGTASFTATQTSGHIEVTSTSTGTNNQCIWAIRQNGAGVATGSGNSFTSPTLTNGVYQVCLYLYSSNQTLCDSTCQYVTVTTANPCLGLSAQWTKTYNTNNSISFSASNQASGNQYFWTFGDGTSATTADPVHGYVTAGLYNVCLVVWRSGTNCSDTVCQNLQANPATTTCISVASFTTTVVNGSIHTTSTSTNVGTATRYAWALYGSNNTLIQTQTGANSSFQSQALPNGNYTVCLLLFSNNTQTLCDSACVTVSVTNGNACSALNANYTYSYQTNGGVHFYPVTNPGTATHYWNFGDGSTSTNADPVHYYSTAGLYTICHFVEIPGANCFDSTCTTIQVTAGNPCSGFTVNVNTTSGWFTTRHLEAVTAGGTAPFTYAWSNGATTASIYPTSTGTYCVTVYDARQCSATDCETFTVTTPACNASYSYTRTNCNTVQFNNASTGGYTNVVWNFGDGSSSSALNPIHTFPVGTWTVQLTVYSTGTNCQASYYQVITIQPCGINDTICGVVFNDINGNGVQETNEPGIGGGVIYAGNYHETVSSNGHYTLILPAGNYTLYYCAPAGYSFTIPVGTQTPNSSTNTCAYYTITTSGGSHCGYNFGVQNNSSTVCGTVYFDANNNQVQDAGETGTANAHIFATLSNGSVVHAYTDQSGHYCITLAPGTYTLTVSTGLGATATPQSITLTTVAGTNYNNNNFGIYTQPGSCNLKLDIVPHTTITAGFAAWYDLVVTNLGASTSNGTVSMFFDPAITFTSASPAQTTVNNSTQTVTWDFTGLTPGSTRHFWANFRALTNIQINQPVFTLANVVTNNCNEVDFTDNVDTVHQNVTASWDPNNKLVVPDGIIKGDERLTYTVNFQNTGTAPAVNVVVRDIIAPELDIETFRMVDASHAYTVQLAGREVIWKFNAIMLPDSNTNEPQSHGHVTFSILPVANQNKGTQITNKADIYFDYNEPVLTNSTLNTIDYELSVNDLENGKVAITLMPNPFKEFTTIKIDGENTAYELKLFDMLGQQVYQDKTSNNVFSIQRQILAAGVFVYQVSKQGKVIGQGKMIAE